METPTGTGLTAISSECNSGRGDGPWGRVVKPAPHGSGETADGRGFVFVNFENGIQLRDLQQIFHAFREVQQF